MQVTIQSIDRYIYNLDKDLFDIHMRVFHPGVGGTGGRKGCSLIVMKI